MGIMTVENCAYDVVMLARASILDHGTGITVWKLTSRFCGAQVTSSYVDVQTVMPVAWYRMDAGASTRTHPHAK